MSSWAGRSPRAVLFSAGSRARRMASPSSLALSGLSSLTAGATDHLRVTLTLPSGAGNTLQNQTSTISYAFNGTQRTATNK